MRQGLGTCSSGFMPGHRIDNQLLRPHSGNQEQAARDGSHSASGSADSAQDRLPRCWTQYENNCNWEAPDRQGAAPYLNCWGSLSNWFCIMLCVQHYSMQSLHLNRK